MTMETVKVSKETAGYLRCLRILHLLEKEFEKALKADYGEEQGADIMEDDVKTEFSELLAAIEMYLLKSIHSRIRENGNKGEIY